jgi:hypothetical protein
MPRKSHKRTAAMQSRPAVRVNGGIVSTPILMSRKELLQIRASNSNNR